MGNGFPVNVNRPLPVARGPRPWAFCHAARRSAGERGRACASRVRPRSSTFSGTRGTRTASCPSRCRCGHLGNDGLLTVNSAPSYRFPPNGSEPRGKAELDLQWRMAAIDKDKRRDGVGRMVSMTRKPTEEENVKKTN